MRVPCSCLSVQPSPASYSTGYVFLSSLMSVFDRPFQFFDVISASKQFAEEVLKAHNDYRKKHGVPPLKLCKKLNRGAQQWVQSFIFFNEISVTFIGWACLCILQKYLPFDMLIFNISLLGGKWRTLLFLSPTQIFSSFLSLSHNTG